MWCNMDRGGHWYTKKEPGVRVVFLIITLSLWEYPVMHCLSACLVSVALRLSLWLSTSSVNQPKTNTVRRQWSLCGRCQPGSLDVWPRFRVKLLSWCLLSALFWCHWEGYNTWSHFGWNKVKIFDIFIKISVSLFPLSKCCETEVTQPTAKSRKQCWVGVPWEITSGILFSLLGFCDWLMNPRLLHCWKIMTLNSSLGKIWRTRRCVGKAGAKVNVVAFLPDIDCSLLTAAEAVWEMSSLSVTDSWELTFECSFEHTGEIPTHTHAHNHRFQCPHRTHAFKIPRTEKNLTLMYMDWIFPQLCILRDLHCLQAVGFTWCTPGKGFGYDCYSQFVSFEGSVVQQVEASVVLLGEVDVGHQD